MSSDNIKLLKENQKSIYPQTLSDAVLMEEDSNKTLLEHIEENFATKDEAANNTTMMNKVNVALAEFKDDVLEALNDVADTEHNHDDRYALKDHKHDEYLTRITSHFHKYNDILFPDGVSDNETLKKEVEKRVTIDYFNEEINNKANVDHAHPEYADFDHTHDSQYAPLEHNHDAYYSQLNHNHDNLYMPINKTFDDRYSRKDHNHDYNDLINKPTIPTVESIKNSLDLDRYDGIIDNLAQLVNETNNANILNSTNIEELKKEIAASANREHIHAPEDIIIKPANEDAGEASINLKQYLDTKADSLHVHNLEDLPSALLTEDKGKELLNSEVQFNHKHSVGDLVDLLTYPVDGGNDRLATRSYVDDTVIEGMSSIDYNNITGLEERLQQTETTVSEYGNYLLKTETNIRNELGESISKNSSDINDIINILPKREQTEDEEPLEPVKLLKAIAPVDHYHEYEDLPADIVSVEKLDGYVKPYVEGEFSNYTENVLEPLVDSKLENYSTIDHTHEDINNSITVIESGLSNTNSKLKELEDNNLIDHEAINKKFEEYTLKVDFDERINYIQSNYSAIDHIHEDYALVDHEHDNYAIKEDVYNKTEIDSALDTVKNEINIAAYATKEEVIQQLESKADLVHTHEEEFTAIDTELQAIDDKFKEYTKSSEIEKIVDDTVALALTNKVDKTTLELNYQTTQVSDLKYAKLDHTHEYSPLGHNHDDKYSLKEHLHENTYYTQEFIKENYALNTHKHDDLYASLTHTHNDYAVLDHNHDDKYMPINATFDEKYSKVDHKHEEYALKEEAAKDHDHDDKYAKIDELAEKADREHTHEEYAEKEHEHGDYIKSQDANEMFAPKEHEHEDYALAEHTHEDYLSIATAEETYATKEEVEAKSENGHTHEEYATKEELKEYSKSDHLHEDVYAPKDHEHIIYADKEHTHEDYALYEHNHDDLYVKIEDDIKEHTHEDYALKEEVAPLEHNHDDKYALIDHIHEDYAVIDHEHAEYAIKEEVETMFDDRYASIEHEHEDYALKEEVATKEHTHDDRYSLGTHKHDLLYAAKDHDHPSFDSKYAAKDHTHSNYVDNSTLTNNYYNKSETDNALKSHNHDSDYYRKNETLSAAETELKIVKAELGITKDSIKEVIDETTNKDWLCSCDICQNSQMDEDGNVIKGVTISGNLATLYTAQGADLSFYDTPIFERVRVLDNGNEIHVFGNDISISGGEQEGDIKYYLIKKELTSNLILENNITGLRIYDKINEDGETQSTINTITTNITEVILPADKWTQNNAAQEGEEVTGYRYDASADGSKNKNIIAIFSESATFLGIRIRYKDIVNGKDHYTPRINVSHFSMETGDLTNVDQNSFVGQLKAIIFKKGTVERNTDGTLVYDGKNLAISGTEVSSTRLEYNDDRSTAIPSSIYNVEDINENNDTNKKFKITSDKLLIENENEIYVINGDKEIRLPSGSYTTNIDNLEDGQSAPEKTINGLIFRSITHYTLTDNKYEFFTTNGEDIADTIEFALNLGDDGKQITLDKSTMIINSPSKVLFSASTGEELSLATKESQTKIKITEAEFTNLYSIMEQKVTVFLSDEYDKLMEKLTALEGIGLLKTEYEDELKALMESINASIENFVGNTGGEDSTASGIIEKAFNQLIEHYIGRYPTDENGNTNYEKVEITEDSFLSNIIKTTANQLVQEKVNAKLEEIATNLNNTYGNIDLASIQKLSTDIGTIKEDFSNIEGKVETAKTLLETTQTSLETITGAVSVLETYLGDIRVIPAGGLVPEFVRDADENPIPLKKTDKSEILRDDKTPFYQIKTEEVYSAFLIPAEDDEFYNKGILTKAKASEKDYGEENNGDYKLPENFIKITENVESFYQFMNEINDKITGINDEIEKLKTDSDTHINDNTLVESLNRLLENASYSTNTEEEIQETALNDISIPSAEEETQNLIITPIVNAVYSELTKNNQTTDSDIKTLVEETKASIEETQNKISESLKEIDNLLLKFDTSIAASTDEVEDMIEDLNNNIEIYNIQLENLRDDIFGHVDNKLEKYDAQFQLEIQDFNDRVLEPKEILMANKIEELQSSMDDFNYSCEEKMIEFDETLSETQQAIEEEKSTIIETLNSLKEEHILALDEKVEDLAETINQGEESINLAIDEAELRLGEAVNNAKDELLENASVELTKLEEKNTEIINTLNTEKQNLTDDIETRIINFSDDINTVISDFTEEYNNTITSFNEDVNILFNEEEIKLNEFRDDLTDTYETKISEFKNEITETINTHDAKLSETQSNIEKYFEDEKVNISNTVDEKCNELTTNAQTIADKNISDVTIVSQNIEEICNSVMVEHDEQLQEKFEEINSKIDDFEYRYTTDIDTLDTKISETTTKFEEYDNTIKDMTNTINTVVSVSENKVNEVITEFNNNLDELINSKSNVLDTKITTFEGTMNQTINDFRDGHLLDVSSTVSQMLDEFQYNVMDEFENEVDNKINEIPSVDLYKAVFDETVELKVNPVVESLNTMREVELKDMSNTVLELSNEVKNIKADAISDLIASDVMTKDMIQDWLAKNPTAHSHSTVHIYASEEEIVEGSPRAKYFYYKKSEEDNEVDESQRDYFIKDNLELGEYDPERKRLTIDKVYVKRYEVTQKIDNAKQEIYTELENKLADTIQNNIMSGINEAIQNNLQDKLVNSYKRYIYDSFYQIDENGNIVYDDNRNPIELEVNTIDRMMQCMKANESNHSHANYVTISELLNTTDTSLLRKNYYTKSQVDARIQQKVENSMNSIFTNKVNEIESNVTNNISENIQNNYVLKSDLDAHLNEYNLFKDTVALKNHNHDTVYATKKELSEKANFTHNHDGVYAPAVHQHPEYQLAGNYVTKEEVENNMVLDGVYARVDSTYTKDVIYTKAETDALMTNYHNDFLRKDEVYNKTDIDSLVSSIREDINNVNQIPDNLYTKQEVLNLINSAVEHLHDDYTQRLSAIEERLARLEQ